MAPSSRGIRAAAIVTAIMLLAAVWTGRDRIERWFGPPHVMAVEKYAESPGGPTCDNTLFNELLAQHVSQTGHVDYAGLASEVGKLDQYLASLATAELDRYGRSERLALLINAYNAFTLRLILDYYPLNSIKDIPDANRWDAQRWNLGSNVLSLNQIEHDLIRADFQEPRVHFALVCAAMGCPPLRNEAYTGDRLEEQLDDQTRRVHDSPAWFAFDAPANELRLTSLYKWYSGDFEQAAGSVLDFAARYSLQLKTALDAGQTPTIVWLDYDWSLNSQQNGP